VIRTFVLIPVIALLAFAPAAAEGTSPICAPADSSVYFDTLSGVTSPCAVAPGTFIAEATYLQNASSVGGTAVASYPVLTLRTGITKDLGFIFNAPSEIAESGDHGLGLFLPTHLGYGLTYTASETDRSAIGVFTEVLPPVSRFSPNQTQSKYTLGATSDFEITPKFTLGFAGAETSSASVGFDRILPSGALTAAYSTSPATQVSTDLGTRVAGRHSITQSYSDVGIGQAFSKHFVVKVGLGTTFNSVGNTKPHYLASGVDYKF
jgi:hypothetical protein